MNKSNNENGHQEPGTTRHEGYALVLSRNALFNLLRYFFAFFLTILVTPYILHKTGIQSYGTWALILSISSLPILFDLGLGAALTKFVPEAYTQDRKQEIRKMVSVTAIFFAVIVVFIVFF